MLSEKLRELRLKAGIFCSELARLSSHPVSSIHNIEAGVTENPDFKTICDIAEVLKADLGEIRDSL